MAWEKVPGSSPYASGFVLAGGQSTRMGQDKALMRLGGKTLVEIALEKLGEVCPAVAISGREELAPFGTVVPDGLPGCGPLGGIAAALEQSATEWNLFLPVDVPLIPVDVLRTLVAHAGGDSVAVLAESGGFKHPLCGVYARRALPVLQAALAAGQYKVRAAVEAAGQVAWVPFPEADWFRNLNTPEEFAQAERSLANSVGVPVR